MKTSDLIGDALDWAVDFALHGECGGYSPNEYSTDWAQGGPIIEREKISLVRYGDSFSTTWEAFPYCDKNYIDSGPGEDGIGGPTPLIAAMRCYVASKLGDEVKIPEKLK